MEMDLPGESRNDLPTVRIDALQFGEFNNWLPIVQIFPREWEVHEGDILEWSAARQRGRLQVMLCIPTEDGVAATFWKID